MADNLFSDLNRMIEQVGKDKGIDRQIVIDAVVQGMLVAARKKYGSYRDIEAMFNDEIGEVELVEFKEVVAKEDYIDDQVEIPLEEAQELDDEAQIGDSIGIALDTKELGRIAAQTARQIIIQRVRDAERDVIHAEFSQREGEIASGIARRVERGSIVVDLGRTEAYLPYREQIPGEQYKSGDRIQGYLSEVRQTTRGPQIIMSRADERYLMKLFEIEVPEIYDGIVEIVAAAREPGQRAKIAVRSSDPSVDPVGACVGMKGSRVQNIVQELRGEKIDIVIFEEDITRFACNALAPAEISKVFMDEVSRAMEVVVPDNQLSLAIGKKGQNVRLAAKLTGWKLDIVSESQAASKAADAVFNLMLIPGVSDTQATALFQYGYGSFQAIADANPAEIANIPGYDEDSAEGLVASAKELVTKYADGAEVPTRPEEEKAEEAAISENIAAAASGNAKDQAEQRLKDAFAELNQSGDESPEVAPVETTDKEEAVAPSEEA
jgi:N utilization substance protein A